MKTLFIMKNKNESTCPEEVSMIYSQSGRTTFQVSEPRGTLKECQSKRDVELLEVGYWRV